MNSDELIIRNEAVNFYHSQLRDYKVKPIEAFKKLKGRLNDFYSPESKAVFLDEIVAIEEGQLKKHRDDRHGGEALSTCHHEQISEALLFYIRQEVKTFPAIAHQRFANRSGHERSKVFVSYSHNDKDYLKYVQRHFKPFLGDIDFWDDSKILPGKKWKEEIKNAIAETKVAILLLSTDFLGSDFIATDELPPLLKAAEEDGAVILIVILKPCLFEEFQDLNQYQALNGPNEPVARMSEEDREDFFVNLVRQTKRILKP